MVVYGSIYIIRVCSRIQRRELDTPEHRHDSMAHFISTYRVVANYYYYTVFRCAKIKECRVYASTSLTTARRRLRMCGSLRVRVD